MSTRRTFLCLMLLLCALPARAANLITATIQLTNVPVSANALTNNSDVRIWTNVNTASLILTNSVDIPSSTTNLYNHISRSPFGGTAGVQRQSLTWSNSTSIVLRAESPLVLGIRGGWASVSYVTNAISNTVTYVSYPFDRLASTDRTNMADALIYGLGKYPSTNQVPPTATAWTNFLNKSSASQVVTGKVLFVYGVGGTNTGLTNGTIAGAVVTNSSFEGGTIGAIGEVELYKTVLNDGNGDRIAFKGPSGLTNAQLLAKDSGVVLYGGTLGSSTPLDARAPDDQGVVLNYWTGIRIFPNLTSGIYIGTNVWNIQNDWFGALNVFHDQLGASNFWATGYRQTNGVHYGTNIIAGRLQYPRAANSGLVNGNNANILLGTNVYITLSGPTTISEIAGFAAEPDGAYHIVQFRGAATNWLVNYTGSSRATDAIVVNRIETGEPSNADILMTNNPSWAAFIYDGSVSRWQVISHSK